MKPSSDPSSHLPTLSLVIPAYNEQDTIAHVLESIREQQSELHEIIVIDNNSTDRTAEILAGLASAFPKLRVITETQPGVISARNAGFDAATGDLIGRLDADARAKPGWARAAREFFATADSAIGAGSGRFDQYDMPLQWVHRLIMGVAMRNGEDTEVELPTLYGANMVIRRTAWERIRPRLLTVSGVFDDLDITLCLTDAGLRSVLVPGMEISASGRRMLSSVSEYKTFTGYMPATYRARGMEEQARKIERERLMMQALHLLFYIPVRAWDPLAGRYSLSHLRAGSPARVLPYAPH